MQSLMYIAEYRLTGSQEMDWNSLQIFSHIVLTWLLLIKSRYGRIFQQVTHKWEDSEMKYIKIFQNAQALSVSVGNNSSQDLIMHLFLDNFHQGGKCSAQIASYQEKLSRKGKFTEKIIFISLILIDRLSKSWQQIRLQ